MFKIIAVVLNNIIGLISGFIIPVYNFKEDVLNLRNLIILSVILVGTLLIGDAIDEILLKIRRKRMNAKIDEIFSNMIKSLDKK